MLTYYISASDEANDDFSLFVSASGIDNAVKLWRDYYELDADSCWDGVIIRGAPSKEDFNNSSANVFLIEPRNFAGVYNWDEMVPVAHVQY